MNKASAPCPTAQASCPCAKDVRAMAMLVPAPANAASNTYMARPSRTASMLPSTCAMARHQSNRLSVMPAPKPSKRIKVAVAAVDHRGKPGSVFDDQVQQAVYVVDIRAQIRVEISS